MRLNGRKSCFIATSFYLLPRPTDGRLEVPHHLRITGEGGGLNGKYLAGLAMMASFHLLRPGGRKGESVICANCVNDEVIVTHVKGYAVLARWALTSE